MAASEHQAGRISRIYPPIALLIGKPPPRTVSPTQLAIA